MKKGHPNLDRGDNHPLDPQHHVKRRNTPQKRRGTLGPQLNLPRQLHGMKGISMGGGA